MIKSELNLNLNMEKRFLTFDLIVLAGNVGVEEAARKVAIQFNYHFNPGRTDATQENT